MMAVKSLLKVLIYLLQVDLTKDHFAPSLMPILDNAKFQNNTTGIHFFAANPFEVLMIHFPIL